MFSVIEDFFGVKRVVEGPSFESGVSKVLSTYAPSLTKSIKKRVLLELAEENIPDVDFDETELIDFVEALNIHVIE